MNKKQHFSIVIALLSVALNSCTQGDASLIAKEDTYQGSFDESPVPDVVPAQMTGKDPLVDYQWYLRAEDSLAVTPGIGPSPVGADINAFANGIYAQGYKGEGVKVAVLDTGLDVYHPDLVANVRQNGSWNFLCQSADCKIYDPSPSPSLEADHGTLVAGIIGARGDNAVGLHGVAPRVSLQAFNLLAGGVAVDAEPAAMGLANDEYPLPSADVDIFNRSYGTNPISPQNFWDDYDTQTTLNTLKAGTTSLRQGLGAIYIKAAGNEYDQEGSCLRRITLRAPYGSPELSCYNTNLEPENNQPYGILVGAFNGGFTKSTYANTGSSLWISAPGGENEIISTDVAGCDAGGSNSTSTDTSRNFDLGLDSLNTNCDYYSRFVGTSAAAPMVAGVVALLLEANPRLSWRDVKGILARSASPIDTQRKGVTLALADGNVFLPDGWITNGAGLSFSNWYGFGKVDVQGALNLAKTWTPLPPLAQTSQHSSSGLNLAIPDFSKEGLKNSLNFHQAWQLEGVRVIWSGSHSRPQDLALILTSPAGTQSLILSPLSALTQSFSGETAISHQALFSNAFYGENAQGTWTLQWVDVQSGHTGRVDAWSLDFFGHRL